MKNNVFERVLLIQRRYKGEKRRLDELRELAMAAGYLPVLEIEQIREPCSKYQIGPGKVKELTKIIKEKNINKVIFYNELKPNQVHNLMKEWGVEVIDRFQLILEIFEKRAGSKEAKLQIELARLKRELSFIKERIHLAKKEEFAGFLGGGRYAIDAYYRHVISRIAKIERELRKIRRRKKERIKARRNAGLSTISLTGYTGAGKTTLFNKLTGEQGYIDGKPFATLSTTTRKINLLGRKVLISDTIGFIEDLPPLLIDAFYTTLEEIAMADLVLLLVDGSENYREIERKVNASMEALETVGVAKSNVIGVLNKIDLIRSRDELVEKMELLKDYINSPIVPISAVYGINLDYLKKVIITKLPNYTRAIIKLPLDGVSKSVISKILDNACILGEQINGSYIELTVESKKDWLLKFSGVVNEVGGSIVFQ